MAVKRSQSATRVLAVLESIARQQPIGVSALARSLDEDKSAVQRAIMTLADQGWVCMASGLSSKWQLTGHLLAVAQAGRMSNGLRQRARVALERLRDESGETVLLVVPDIRRFIVIDVFESRQMLRAAPTIGMSVPVRRSASSRAILPHMRRERQIELLGEPPDESLLEEFTATLKVGFSVSDGDVVAGSTSVAAPILDIEGRPYGAIVVSGPSERLGARRQRSIGVLALQAVHDLSRHPAPPCDSRPGVQR